MKHTPTNRRLPVLILLLCWASADVSWAKRLNGFDVSDATIPVRQIKRGGPARDEIPAINQPRFQAADDANLAPDARMIGLSIGGEARAYPIAILNWHEVVNDTLGAQHVAVTYCPLCGTGMVFATNVGDDRRLVLGVSGLLYNSDVLLFDRNTESLWSQILGQAISGPLKGRDLPQIPAENTTWAAWQKAYPHTKVLSTDTGYRRNYRTSPYRGYEKSRRLYFNVANKAPKTYHPKALVLGLKRGDTYRAYPFSELAANGKARITEQIGGDRVHILWDADAQSARVLDADQQPLPSVTAYWFAWYAFHPTTQVFRATAGKPQK